MSFFKTLFRGRAGALPALLAFALLGGTAVAANAQEVPAAPAIVPTAGVLVDTIHVEGNRRVTAAAVRQLSGLQAGARVSALDIQNAIRRLMATGNFETVEVYSAGDPTQRVALTMEVAERPFIAQVEFRGLQRVSPRAVRDTIGIRDNQPLDPQQVARTQEMIRNLLGRAGFQVLSVDTTLTALSQPEGAYRLTYHVEEGARLTISEVVFEGNQMFSDATLRGAMRTRPEGFWWFRPGRFDREVFQQDLRERLPEFYGARGFIDFAVLSDSLVVDPETGNARLVVSVAEGPQYRLGEFDVDGNSRFPTDQLAQIFTAQRRSVLGLPFIGAAQRERGEIFDRSALDAATRRVEQLYRNEGFLYAQVEPIIERVEAAPSSGEGPTVNVTWQVVERSPFYINRIRIAGNTNTHESVIRDQLFVFPGDVYNEERLIQSYQAISALGFFETPMPTPDILPNPEAGEVDIVFNVREKQTGSINFGTMFGGQRGGGISGFVGYSQPNLFGQAKAADLRAEYGWGRNSFQATYTDPALFGTRNSGSASLFHMGDRYFRFADGRRIQTGGSLRYGMPVPGLFRTRAFLGYSLSTTRYEAVDQDCDQQDLFSIFCLPTATASNLSAGLTRDTRNHPLFPTVGTRQSLTVAQTGGPLGGDGNYQKVSTDLDWWVPVGSFGAGTPGMRPIRMTVGLQARVGAVFGDATPFPFERFFVGGTQFGQQLRGYDETEITPLGYIPRNVTGIQSGQRLGDAFLTVTGEYAVRFTDNISVSAFADAGNVWNRVGDMDPSRLFRSAGLGITIVTPFGPLGLDYAYGFDRTEPGWKFHFKLGQGF
jgi:outer membrane protein insertion porin family